MQKTRVPQVTFQYSPPYDEERRDSHLAAYPKSRRPPYPAGSETIALMRDAEAEWRKVDRSVLETIATATSLPWCENEVTCYVVGGGRSLSDPLTLHVYEDPTLSVDRLTHEMIHRNLCKPESRNAYEHAMRHINERHATESRKTRIHIPVHAVHAHVYRTLFTDDRLKRDIEGARRMKSGSDYMRAWAIVMSEDPEMILEEFRREAKTFRENV